jgi:uncharacterized FlaG/YvyC family protein
MEGSGDRPLDPQALSSSIIELNIARRNASLYPRGHALVSLSLERACSHLRKLFDLREEVVIAVTKDTLVVDKYALEKENPVFREFAGVLRNLNIACVKFGRGLAEDEIYGFQRLLLDEEQSLTRENVEAVTAGYGLRHITLLPVDYGVFTLDEGKVREGHGEENLLARYVHGLLEGTLGGGEAADDIRNIPPEELAQILNGMKTRFQEESYDRVITTYLRTASEKSYTGAALQRLMSMIDELNPKLKEEFLSSSVKVLSKDSAQLEQALKDIPQEKVLDFLRSIQHGNVRMPKVFSRLMERFSELKPEGLKELGFSEGLMADDFFLSQKVVDLLDERRYEEHIPLSYREELQRIMSAGLGGGASGPPAFGKEWSRERMEYDYNQILLELLTADLAPDLAAGGQERLAGVFQDQVRHFAEDGDFGSLLQTLAFLDDTARGGSREDIRREVSDYCDSEEFAALVVDALKRAGRGQREKALAVCRRFAETVAPLLMDSLAEEEGRFRRKFFIEILKGLGDESVQQARARLHDDRWFVRRNMLLILCECGVREVLDEVRPYCGDSDGRVRAEALRCLLRAQDEDAVETLRQWLFSGEKERMEQAIHLAGTHQVKALLPELLAMLRARAKRGRDYEIKVHLVRSLGLIGDDSVLDSLRNILSSSSFFFKADLEKLKRETYKVMDKFLVGGTGKAGKSAGT